MLLLTSSAAHEVTNIIVSCSKGVSTPRLVVLMYSNFVVSGFDAGGDVILLCSEAFSLLKPAEASLQKATLYRITAKIVTLFTLCSSGKCGSILGASTYANIH